MSDIKTALGPHVQNYAIDVIASAFEARDKNLNHIMQNVVEAFKGRDAMITELSNAIVDLKRQVAELQDQRIDNIILKE